MAKKKTAPASKRSVAKKSTVKRPKNGSDVTVNKAVTPQTTLDKIVQGLCSKDWAKAESALKKNIPLYLDELWKKYDLDDYNPILFLDQSNQVGEEHADQVYTSLCKFEAPADILLILGSRGGRIEPAYLISKNCKASAKNRFVAVVPRRAKSAATLITLGADEIHMGSMSELGPIDPQLGGIPALSLTNALDTIAKLVSKHEGSSEMFSQYLRAQLDLSILGYFERINESATQYASRLLQGRQLGDNQNPDKLADHLVNHYKDHSFVIDKDEAKELFGTGMLKTATQEYLFANEVDQNLRLIASLAKMLFDKVVTFVGDFENCVKHRDATEKDN